MGIHLTITLVDILRKNLSLSDTYCPGRIIPGSGVYLCSPGPPALPGNNMKVI